MCLLRHTASSFMRAQGATGNGINYTSFAVVATTDDDDDGDDDEDTIVQYNENTNIKQRLCDEPHSLSNT